MTISLNDQNLISICVLRSTHGTFVFRSLRKFWERELTKRGADLNLIDFFGTIALQRPYFWFSVHEYIMDDSQIVIQEADDLYPKNGPLSEEAKKNIEHYKNAFEFYNPDPEKSLYLYHAGSNFLICPLSILVYEYDSYSEIVNGSEVFTNLLWDKVKAFEKFKFHLNTKVLGVQVQV